MSQIDDIPVGCKEVAEHLQRKVETVYLWKHRGLLPRADFTVGGRPAWWLHETIDEWARKTGRLGWDEEGRLAS